MMMVMMMSVLVFLLGIVCHWSYFKMLYNMSVLVFLLGIVCHWSYFKMLYNSEAMEIRMLVAENHRVVV